MKLEKKDLEKQYDSVLAEKNKLKDGFPEKVEYQRISQ